MLPTRIQWKKWSLPSKLTAIGTAAGVVSILLFVGDKLYSNFILDPSNTAAFIEARYKDKEDYFNQELNSFKNGAGSLLKTLRVVKEIVLNRDIALSIITSENSSLYLTSILEGRKDTISLDQFQRIVALISYKKGSKNILSNFVGVMSDNTTVVSDSLLQKNKDEQKKEVSYILQTLDFRPDRINEIVQKAGDGGETHLLLEALLFKTYGQYEVEDYLKIYEVMFYALFAIEEEFDEKRQLLIDSIPDDWIKERVRRIVSVNTLLGSDIVDHIEFSYADSCDSLSAQDVYSANQSTPNRIFAALCSHGIIEEAEYSAEPNTNADCQVYSVLNERYECFEPFTDENVRLTLSLLFSSPLIDKQELMYWVDIISRNAITNFQKGRLLSILLRKRVIKDKGEEAFEHFTCKEIKSRSLKEIDRKSILDKADVQCAI